MLTSRPWLMVLAVAVGLTAAWGQSLQPADWQDRSVDGQVRFEPQAVVLAVRAGQGGTAELAAKVPTKGDFQLDIAYHLLDWVAGSAGEQSLTVGLADEDETKAQITVGRGWQRSLEEHVGMVLRDSQWRSRFAALTDGEEGRLRFTRRQGQIHAQAGVPHGYQTMATLDWAPNASLYMRLGLTNTPAGNGPAPAVRVRFDQLRIEQWPNRPRPGGGGGAAAGGGDDKEWVLWGNDVGWLHVGSRAAFKRPTPHKAEILGGQGDEPLKNTEIQGEFANRDEALAWLCDHLTKVRVDYHPTGSPKEIVMGVVGDQDYKLRLVGENDPEALTMAENYDFAGEKAVLAKHGLTPRCGYGRLWLVYILGHGTVDGWAQDNRWVTFPAPPQPMEKEPQKGAVEVADGWGGTFTYVADKWEGPYRDNFGLASAMRRLGVQEVDIYPPANNYQRHLRAAEVPEKPRDFGSEVLGLQPIADPPGLRDWVVYLTGGTWLHIGTRTEYETPVTRAQTLWAGEGDALVPKKIVDLGRPFGSYDSALRTVAKGLQNVRSRFSPSNQPRELVTASLGGADVVLHLARDPFAMVAGYGGYNYGAEVKLLRDLGIGVRKEFGAQRLVHATGHGTMNGPVKDDFWMMVKGEIRGGNSIELPDGMGGTFGYSLDKVAGPFTDSFALVTALTQHGLKSIGLYGEDRGVGLLDGQPPTPPPLPAPRILSLTPERGEAGQTFYITVIAEGMRPGYGFAFGPGLAVSDETCLGKNPDGPGERWLATITVERGASFGPVVP